MVRNTLIVTAVIAALLSQGGTPLRAHGHAGDRVAVASTTPVFKPNPMQVATLRWYPAIRADIETPAGAEPLGLAFDGAHLWEVDQKDNRLTVWDPTTHLQVVNVSTVQPSWLCTEPSAIVIVANSAWISCIGSDRIENVILAGTVANPKLFTGWVSVGAQPYGMAFDGRQLWVANSGGNTVSRVDPATYAHMGSVTVGQQPFSVAYDGTHVWVTNRGSNTVTEINAANSHVVATVKVGSQPYGIAFDGQNMWVSNSGGNTVSEIAVATAKVIKTVTVGNGPSAMVYDGQHIWSANYSSNTVSEIGASTGTVVATVHTGAGPSGLAFDGTKVWVSDYTAGTIQAL